MEVVASIVVFDDVEEEVHHRACFLVISRSMPVYSIENARDSAVQRFEILGFVVFQRLHEPKLHFPELSHHDGDHGYLP